MTTTISPEFVPCRFRVRTHALTQSLIRCEEDYFLRNWPFRHAHARNYFLKSDTTLYACLIYPDAVDSKIRSGARIMSLLFLLDDFLDDWTPSESKAVLKSLELILLNPSTAPVTNALERCFYDCFAPLHTSKLGYNICTTTVRWFHAAIDTSARRRSITNWKDFLPYRIEDSGYPFVTAVLRYVLDLHLSPAEAASLHDIERNAAIHFMLINDLYSYNKEICQNDGQKPLVNAVYAVMLERGVGEEEARETVWGTYWECEDTHKASARDLKGNMKRYTDALRHLLGGNAYWHTISGRYEVANIPC